MASVLFVTLYALETNTSVSISNKELIKGLIRNGFSVTVLVPSIDSNLPYYDKSGIPDGIKIIRINNNNLGTRIAKTSSNLKGAKVKIIKFLRTSYYKLTIFDRTKVLLKQAKKVIDLLGEYDIVISTSDPKTSHLFVQKLINNGLKYKKWIQHWGDPLVGDISKNNVYPNFYLKYIEKRIIKKADRIVYVSPFTYEAQKRIHKTKKNCIMFVPLPCVESLDENKKELSNGKINVVYMGDYNTKIRNILPFYNAMKNQTFADVVIAGNSDLSLKDTKSVKILPRISQSQASYYENKADIIICIGNRKGTQIPGKIYYSAASKKHILYVVDGEKSDDLIKYLKTFNRFNYCLNNEENIYSAILKLSKKSRSDITTPEKLLSQNIVKEIVEF